MRNHYIKDGDKLTLGGERVRLIYWILLFVCVIFYIFFNSIILSLVPVQGDVTFIKINKYTLSGIITQGQVVSVVLLTLIPIKRSYLVALLLCALTGTVSFINVLTTGSAEALPGIIVPATSSCICLIINYYAKRLKRQLNKVLDYSKIVKKNEEMLHSLAYYDTLTGLPNSKTLEDQIEALIDTESGLAKSSFYLVYLDIDDFKKINDTMGHSVGDVVIQNVAMRWKRYCHNEDMLARMGGDEFVLLICHEMNPEQLDEYLKGFRDVLKKPFSIGLSNFNIHASYGITKYPNDGDDIEELFKNADIALDKAKHQGKNNCQFFCKAMKENVFRRIRLENDLLSAISNNELYMVYQPQYECHSMKLRGFEALVRWRHSELGLISPIEFIPIAESSGFINEMGKWIIENVLNTFMALRKSTNIETVVAINISIKQILEPSFVSTVKEILKKTCFDSRYLEFEITESVFITSPDYVISVMNQLKALGIGIALDDFGTGYASLNYLQMLPIHILKIDKTFIDKLNTSHSANQMTGAIISLSHQLGLQVVAEGVETAEQLSCLNEYHCDYIQGYLKSKPVDEAQVARLLSERFKLIKSDSFLN